MTNERILIAFDLDGTLYQTHLSTVQAVKNAFNKVGALEPPADEITALIGKKSFEEFYKRYISDEILRKNAGKMVSDYEFQFIKSHGLLYPGTREMLEYLHGQGFILAICSNGSMEYVETVLNTFDIRKYFSYIRGKEKGKIKPEVFIELMKAVHPENAVFIGDRSEDMEVAEVSGVTGIASAYGYGKDELSSHPFLAHSIAQVTTLIMHVSFFMRIEESIKSCQKRPYVVGFNGIDASGKTIISNNFGVYLKALGYPVCIINIDDYILPAKDRPPCENENKQYYDHAFDLEAIKALILAPATNGEDVDIEIDLSGYQEPTASFKHYRIDRDTVIVIEGVLLYREPLDEYIDYRVFLDISEQTSLERAAIRDVPRYGEDFIDKYHEKFIPVHRHYCRDHHPREKSNMVIDNNDFTKPRIIKSRK